MRGSRRLVSFVLETKDFDLISVIAVSHTYSVRRIIEVIAVFIQPSVSREVQYYINIKKISIAVVNMTHSERIVFKDGEV